MDSPNLITPIIMACSTIIAAVGLIFTGYNSLADRRNRENQYVFDLWERYEKYSANLADSKPEGNDQLRCILNLLNYIENICLLYNTGRIRGIVSENVIALVSDTISTINQQVNYASLIDGFIVGKDGFSETKKFCKKHAILINRKGIDLKGSVFERKSN